MPAITATTSRQRFPLLLVKPARHTEHRHDRADPHLPGGITDTGRTRRVIADPWLAFAQHGSVGVEVDLTVRRHQSPGSLLELRVGPVPFRPSSVDQLA